MGRMSCIFARNSDHDIFSTCIDGKVIFLNTDKFFIGLVHIIVIGIEVASEISWYLLELHIEVNIMSELLLIVKEINDLWRILYSKIDVGNGVEN